MKILYQVVDGLLRTKIGKPKSLKAAHNHADKLDNAYGACRYTVKRVQVPETNEEARELFAGLPL